MFTPSHLDQLADLIRERAIVVLDALPRNETFDFVDRVSAELTTQMLATLFDFPWEERRKLTRWSDIFTALPKSMVVASEKQGQAEMKECGTYFTRLWNERINAEPRSDLLSMMAHNHAMRYMDPANLLGNIFLFIVGGNDTTRNTLTGSVLALHENPDQYRKLRANPALIESMVPEVIRWQTPIAHMRRTTLRETEVGGKRIGKGERVVMWYVSGNRDDEVVENPNRFIIDRPRPRTRSFIWVRHSSLRRFAVGRTSASDRLGRDAETLRGDRGDRRTEARLFELHQGLRNAACPDRRLAAEAVLASSCATCS